MNTYHNNLRNLPHKIILALLLVVTAVLLAVSATLMLNNGKTQTASAATSITKPNSGTLDDKTYTGNVQNWTLTGYWSDGFTATFSYAAPGSTQFTTFTPGTGTNDRCIYTPTSNVKVFFASEAGTYRVQYTLKSNYVWSDNTSGTVTATMTMNPQEIQAPLSGTQTSLTYNGKVQNWTVYSGNSGGNHWCDYFTAVFSYAAPGSSSYTGFTPGTSSGVNRSLFSPTSNVQLFFASEAGTYRIVSTLNSTNYAWEGGSRSTITTTMTMNPQEVQAPLSGTQTSLTYNGKVQNWTVYSGNSGGNHWGDYFTAVFSYAAPGSTQYTNFAPGTSSGVNRSLFSPTSNVQLFFASEAGTYKIVSTLNSTNYAWEGGSRSTITTTMTMNQASLSGAISSVTTAAKTYNGAAQSVSFSNLTITPNGSYAITSSDVTVTGSGTNASSYDVKLTATSTGNYTGSYTASNALTINKASLASATMTVSGTYTYDGTAKKPSGSSVVLKLGNNTLTTSDYTLSYSSNTNAGTATVTATASGSNITASTTKSATFTIGKADLSSVITGVTVNKTYTYTGSVPAIESSNVTPSRSSTNYSISSSDYTVTAAGSTAGTHKVTIKAASTSTNYTGSYTTSNSPLTIAKADYSLSGISLSVPSGVTYDGLEKKATISGTLPTGADNIKLAATVHYVGVNGTVYTDSTIAPTNAGNYKAYIVYSTTSSNYNKPANSADVNFTIAKKAVEVKVDAPESITYGEMTYGDMLAYLEEYGEYSTVSGDFDDYVPDAVWTITASGASDGDYLGWVDGGYTVTLSFAKNADTDFDPANFTITGTFTTKWVIDKADYTSDNASGLMAAIEAFSGETFSSIANAKIKNLPSGYVTVTYSYTAEDGSVVDRPTEAGRYTVTATFTSSNPNYNAPKSVTATLVIEGEDEGDLPGGDDGNGDDNNGGDNGNEDDKGNGGNTGNEGGNTGDNGGNNGGNTGDNEQTNPPVGDNDGNNGGSSDNNGGNNGGSTGGNTDNNGGNTGDNGNNPADPDNGNGDEGSLPLEDSVFDTDLGVFIVLLCVEFIVFLLLIAMVVVSGKKKA